MNYVFTVFFNEIQTFYIKIIPNKTEQFHLKRSFTKFYIENHVSSLRKHSISKILT